MGYYDKEYLEHKMGGWAKKNHKYISRERKNGRWVYVYHDKAFKDTYKKHYVEGRTPEEAMDAAYKNHKEEYNEYADPNYRNSDGSDGKKFASYELQDMARIAKDKRAYQESNPSPKAKLGSAILKLKNAETLLKKKVKDIL